MTTTLGLPLIIGDEALDEPVTVHHNPREPGHPLHVYRGSGENIRGQSYDSVTIRHGAGATPPVEEYQSTAQLPPPGRMLGAYYAQPSARPVSAGAATAAVINPAVGAALGVSPLAAAGLGIGGAALLLTAYVGALGGLGYWIGGLVAPDPEDAQTYKWGGAVANVLAPGLGLGAVALLAMIKKD